MIKMSGYIPVFGQIYAIKYVIKYINHKIIGINACVILFK